MSFGIKPGSVTFRVLQVVPSDGAGMLFREIKATLNAEPKAKPVCSAELSSIMIRLQEKRYIKRTGRHHLEHRFTLDEPYSLQQPAKVRVPFVRTVTPKPPKPELVLVPCETVEEWIARGGKPEVLPGPKDVPRTRMPVRWAA